MTRAERPDGSPVREPKPSWGPGKNAALSIVAFAAIFGAFAYVERDTRVGHANVTHDIAGVIGSAVGKYRSLVETATAGTSSAGASAASAAPGDSTSTVAQAAPPATPAAPASATPSVLAAAEPAEPPPPAARSTARHARATHAPSTPLAGNAFAASASGHAGRQADAHRTSRTQMLARTRKHAEPAPGLQPQSYTADTAHMQPTSVTRDELEGARALARARSCAQIDAWSCVEHNASRALALDPRNSESRALLGQAIRNRL
ncbi:hypothetical protein C7H84_05270 [Burkholderia sp. Nafp2/4-1b]|uniref:hypothetical protein n=1 Tax=Burkholderia sp. Nafp2/4-1b TaxID=2116686 RepID=UPI000EF95B9E|nr:hypothetical protein [Burkholderia sp. Nafp2/4-1b]RKU04333.1 hypothetical protein C7H84_05270 [Burkholderia sp. Nafp2/4-1b]